MSNVTISSAQLTNLGKDNVFTTSANVGYDCSASFTASQDEESELSRTLYSGGHLEYEWTINSQSFTGDSGTAYINSPALLAQAKNQISGSVTVVCIETVTSFTRTQTKPPPNPEYSKWLDTTTVTETGSDSMSIDSISVYTRPGTFTDYNFAADTTIESAAGLTVGKVNNWITHCNAFNNWFNQPASSDNESNVGTTCSAAAGDYITASWYNKCVNAIADQSKRPATVTGGPTGTIITPSVFKALGDAISTTDPAPEPEE